MEKSLAANHPRALIQMATPNAEQDELVARVGALIGSSKLKSAASSRDAQTLGQSILKAAFEGRLVPQDPAYEPASVLLARLRDGSTGADTSRGRRGRKRDRSASLELPLFTARDPRSAADAAG